MSRTKNQIMTAVRSLAPVVLTPVLVLLTHGSAAADLPMEWPTEPRAFYAATPDMGHWVHQPRPREELSPPSSSSAGSDHAAIELRPISEVTVDIRPRTDGGELSLPRDRAAAIFARRPAVHSSSKDLPRRTLVGGPALTELCHQPLYFEEVKLERYGHSFGFLQPAVSGAHFFATLPTLPYRAVVEPPRHCLAYEYDFEAGRHAPPHRLKYPRRFDAGLIEAATIVGLIAAIP